MSRSAKKIMGGGITCADSEAYDKKQWHRAYRRRNKVIANGPADEDVDFVDKGQVSDPWAMSKDGKTIYWTEGEQRKRFNALLNNIMTNQASKHDWYLQDMLTYFKLREPKDLLNLSSAQVEEFVRVFVKRAKAK